MAMSAMTTDPDAVPTNRRCTSGAIARPLGSAGIGIVCTYLGWAVVMSNTSTPWSLRSATNSRCPAWSMATSSNEPVLPAIVGIGVLAILTSEPPHAASGSTPMRARTSVALMSRVSI